MTKPTAKKSLLVPLSEVMKLQEAHGKEVASLRDQIGIITGMVGDCVGSNLPVTENAGPSRAPAALSQPGPGPATTASMFRYVGTVAGPQMVVYSFAGSLFVLLRDLPKKYPMSILSTQSLDWDAFRAWHAAQTHPGWVAVRANMKKAVKIDEHLTMLLERDFRDVYLGLLSIL